MGQQKHREGHWLDRITQQRKCWSWNLNSDTLTPSLFFDTLFLTIDFPWGSSVLCPLCSLLSMPFWLGPSSKVTLETEAEDSLNSLPWRCAEALS